jgi:sugar (pentulose or hexulose) kinase
MVTEHPSGSGSYFDLFLEILGTNWPARLGNEVRPGLTLPFLYWLQQNRRLIDGTTPVTLPDFVAANLCGVKPVMEWTSSTSLLDIQTRSFPVELFEQLKLNKLEWPRIVDFRHQVGLYKSKSAELPVYAPVGDHQCALAGSFLREGELSINISTGSQVAMIVHDTTVGEYQVRPFFDGTYLKTVTSIPAGRALTALVKLLTEIRTAQGVGLDDPWEYAFQQAAATTQSDMITNLAFFPSAVAGPGQFGNLHEGNLTVGHVFRSALEQMADYYEQFATRLSPAREWGEIVFSGGIAQRSDLLRRLICRRLGDQYRLTSSTEDAMLGLMVLARVISRRNPSVREASQDVAQHFSTALQDH